jgi:hypothetical protein
MTPAARSIALRLTNMQLVVTLAGKDSMRLEEPVEPSEGLHVSALRKQERIVPSIGNRVSQRVRFAG